MTKSDIWIEGEKVTDRQSFIDFLRILSEEESSAREMLTADPNGHKYSTVLGWENEGIADYLNAIAACLEDGRWYSDTDRLEWKDLAEIFYFGKIYE